MVFFFHRINHGLKLIIFNYIRITNVLI
ncbi:hypothetical protein V2J09_003781 [Rumex salicifolius]